MKKLIIENRTQMTMYEALEYIRTVVFLGKQSDNGNQYTYVTKFKDDAMVASFKNKNSDRLVVYYEKEFHSKT